MPKDFSPLVSAFLAENAKINLSAIRDEKGIFEKHIFDALEAADFLKSAKKILDIGAGGGFPTFPLAITFPEKHFFPLDATAKKIAAISRISQKIKLKNVFPIAGRAEILAREKDFREHFDAAISRAAAPHAAIVELAAGFLKIGGIFGEFRGPHFSKNDEKIGEKVGLFFREKKEYFLPSGESRAIWIFEKREKCPKTFPRKWAEIKKKPLF